MSEEQVTVATTGPLDNAAIQQVANAAERMRDTARWTVGAVGGLGSALVGVLTVTGLEDLDDWRFWVGVGALAAIVVGVGIVIASVSAVLAPTNSALETVDARHPTLLSKELRLGASSTQQLSDWLLAAEERLRKALAPSTATETGEAEVAHASSLAAIYGDRAERIRLIAHFNELQAMWTRARWGIAGGVLIVLIGGLGYEYAASQQKSAPVRQPKVAAAQELIADFKPGALGGEVTARCAGRRRAVEVKVSGTTRRTLLLRPKGAGCPGLSVRVASSLVTTRKARVPKAAQKKKTAKAAKPKAKAKP